MNAEGGPADFDPTESLPAMQAGAPPPTRATVDSGNAMPVGTTLGEFELLGVVGEGGFGIVYRAWDRSLKRQVAIKEYMPTSLAARGSGLQVSVKSDRYNEPFIAGLNSFVKEAQMLAQFDHPALVKVYRFWEANGSAYMVMPFYEGKTLREELRRRKEPPDEATVLGWLGPVADALAIIHAEHWYHRDIAPDNVMLLAGTQRPLLLDFGAARRVIGDMTQALTVILKPGYAPVEQYAEIPGMRQGPWTDVYALAAVGYYAVRGRTPPPSVGRLVNDSYEPLEKAAAGQYGEGFLKAIDHALHVRPDTRTRSVAEFKAELGLPPPPAVVTNEFAASSVPSSGDPTLPSNDGATDLLLPLSTYGAVPPTDIDLRSSAQPAPAEQRTLVSPRTAYVPAPPVPTVMAPAERTRVVPSVKPPAPAPAPAASAPRPADGGSRWALIGGALVVVAAGIGYVALRPDKVAAPAPSAAAPAPAPVPAPAPAIAPRPTAYDPGADFGRVLAQQTPGWGLEVKVDRDKLRIDRDRLTFNIRSLQEGHVYVYLHGSDGTLMLLYPNATVPSLRIAKGGTLRLPQGQLEFGVSAPAGPNQMLVMVSRWPRQHQAFAPRSQDGFTYLPTGAAAATLEADNKGPLPLVAGRAVCPAGDGCSDAYGAATTRFESIP